MNGDILTSDIEKALSLMPEGDIAEIGVLRGRTFARLVQMSDRHCHAFDSFCGMAEPGPLDGDRYPKGKFDVGGVEAFRKGLPATLSDYTLHPGFIPSCFDYDLKFAFMIIDVDHYQPTMDSLEYADECLEHHGILFLDDYFPGCTELASTAIDEWLSSVRKLKYEVVQVVEDQLMLRKLE